MLKAIIIVAFALLLAAPAALAQSEGLKIEVSGYDTSGQVVYLSFANTGTVTIGGISLSVDGVKIKEIQASFEPGKKIGDMIFLREGAHSIDATTPEGYSDSLNLTIVKKETDVPSASQETHEGPASDWLLENPNILIGLAMVVIVVISMVVIWFIIKSSKHS